MPNKGRHPLEKSKQDFHKRLRSADELTDWLISKGIDISQWGRGAAKSVENLWEEIVSEEIMLQDQPVLRQVFVTQVIIRRGNEMLIEAIQEFADKRQRFRHHPPSEKMKQGEHYVDTAIRCLQEELGVDCQDIEILPSTHIQVEEENESPSYPGLRTRYTFHVVEARVSGLPDADFWTIEAGENEQDLVKRHYWIWRS